MSSVLLGALEEAQIDTALRGPGLGLEAASFRCLIRSDAGKLAAKLRFLYRDYLAQAEPRGFYDLQLTLDSKKGLFKKSSEVEFTWDGKSPFPPLPIDQVHPLFEWGFNWAVASANGASTVIHSAVVERNGLALVLPGDPGSGKSTLCAALCFSGWRLLSDELTIVSQVDGQVQPVPRPISLKNKSIDLIRTTFPEAALTDSVLDTHKGAIAYVRPPLNALQRANSPVPIGFVVFPKYVAGCSLGYEPLSRSAGLTELLANTFNLGLLGSSGFESLAKAIAHARCYAVEYGDLDSILAWVNETCRPPHS